MATGKLSRSSVVRARCLRLPPRRELRETIIPPRQPPAAVSGYPLAPAELWLLRRHLHLRPGITGRSRTTDPCRDQAGSSAAGFPGVELRRLSGRQHQVVFTEDDPKASIQD